MSACRDWLPRKAQSHCESEASDEEVRMIPANAAAVRAALEQGGIDFIAENGRGPGVRLGKERHDGR